MSVARVATDGSARPGPFIVAHRAGNDLDRLRHAEACGITVVEADLHLHRARLEVRHLKTLGPLPILWDRWTLAGPRTPRLRVEQLLEATAEGTELMLDLKGRDVRLSEQLAVAISEHDPRARRRWSVCSRSWDLLEPLSAALPHARTVHSVGSRRQLDALRRRFAHGRLAGVSVHRKLLDPQVAAELRAHADVVLTWPVETPAQARTLAAWGVDGMITESFETLSRALSAPAVA